MARVLDLNNVQQSIMDLTLQDEARTVVHLDLPTEELVQELSNLSKQTEKIKQGDTYAVAQVYDLVARLINCNLDYIRVTASELPTKYRMNLVTAMTFVGAYMDYIKELANSKN